MIEQRPATKTSGPFSFRKTGRYNQATSYSRMTCRQTTIGAAAFHFRVRDGNGWFHRAMVTRTRAVSTGSTSAAVPKTQAAPGFWWVEALVTGLQSPGPASRRHPSECFHSKNSSGPFKTAGRGSLTSAYRRKYANKTRARIKSNGRLVMLS